MDFWLFCSMIMSISLEVDSNVIDFCIRINPVTYTAHCSFLWFLLYTEGYTSAQPPSQLVGPTRPVPHYLNFQGFFFYADSVINITDILIIILILRFLYWCKSNKILKIKEKFQQMKYIELVIDSLVTKYLCSHLYVNSMPAIHTR